LDIYLSLNWKDPSRRHEGPGLHLVNDANVLKELWLPDLYFANAMDASFQVVTIPNFALYIDRDGTISYSSRFMLRAACNLDLSKYPLDRQTCTLKIMSCKFCAIVRLGFEYSNLSNMKLRQSIESS
jgi:gamma-aminobutyric acid receptor subunit theta